MAKLINLVLLEKNAIVFFSIIATFSFGCSIQKTTSQFCGVIIPNFRVYDSVLKKYVPADDDRDPLIFYRDSLIIVERLIVNNRSTNGVLDTTYTEVNFYEFADLKTNTQINFKTFTDTATPMKIFKIMPTLAKKSVWGFYGYGKPIDPDSSATLLKDTIINSIYYKRILTYTTYRKSNKIDTSFTMSYANCNAKNKLFQYSVSLSKKFLGGCPIQMNDLYWTDNPMRLRLKYDFTRDALTPQEHKVFDAWEKYVKEHPIKE